MNIKDQSINFSFKYLTTQKKYNFKYFRHEKQLEQKAKSYLVDKMLFLSQYTWNEIDQLPKNIGYEYIPIFELKMKIPVAFKDVKEVLVFRFDQEDYRIIGIRREDEDTLYIIGFDFDYKAYKHGR